MRPNQIFAAMSQEKCGQIMGKISEESPEAIRQTVVSAATALKFRPQYLLKQPLEKRVASVRRALSRVGSNQLGEELLAVYFLKCRLELLTEWLDLLGLAHEEGILQDDEIACPPTAELEEKVDRFLAVDDDEDRVLLLRVFSAQAAIEWPPLEARLERE